MADTSTQEPIVIDGEQNIKNAAALQLVLAAAAEANGPVEIDAGSVQSVDTASLQLLAAFANALSGVDRSLTWTSVSERMREQADRLGLSAHLQLDSAPGDADDLLPVF